MKIRLTAICVLVALIGMTILPIASGDDGMKLLITLDRDDEYSGGDTGKITVHVFEKGEYVDSDEIPACILEGGGYSDEEVEREIELEKKSTGRYEKEFKIYDSDADDFDRMYLTSEATYGKSDDSDTEYDMDDDSAHIYVEEEAEVSEQVEVRVKGVPTSVFPGDSVTIGIEVRKGTELTDADELEITYQLEYDVGEYEDEEELPYSKVDDGLYQVVLQVPSDIKKSGRMNIEGKAVIDEKDDAFGQYPRLDLLSIWYHEGTIGESICEFDIYVADADGKALPDAEMKIEWETDEGDEGDETELTDDSGKATFEITYDEETTELEVSGNVKNSGKTQYFSGTIEIGEEDEDEEYDEEPSSYGLDIIMKSETLSGKSPFTLECTAYMAGQRMSNEAVYYYLHSKTDIIKHGAATTDVNGEFAISFSYNPSSLYDSFFADFEAVSGDYDAGYYDNRKNTVDGKEYEAVSEYIFYEGDSGGLDVYFDDTSVKIKVAELKRGGLTEVTVKGYSEESMPVIAWIPVEVNGIQDIMDWEESNNWDSWGGDGLMTQDMCISGNEISCSLMIPEFMPSGKYTIIAGYIKNFDADEDYSLEELYHLNNVVVKPGQAGTSETTESSFVESTGFVIIIIGVVLLVLGVIVVAIIIGIRKKKKKEEEKPEWGGDHPNDHLESEGSIPDRTEDGYPRPAEAYPSTTDTYPPPADAYPPPGAHNHHTHGNTPRPPVGSTPAYEPGSGWDDVSRNSGQWPGEQGQSPTPPPYPPQNRRAYPPPY